jgi:hypothetical protein
MDSMATHGIQGHSRNIREYPMAWGIPNASIYFQWHLEFFKIFPRTSVDAKFKEKPALLSNSKTSVFFNCKILNF